VVSRARGVPDGQSADENHVSKTSSSWVSSVEPHSAQASGSVSAMVVCPFGQYHAGTPPPPQSWRETFQGRIFSSQSSATAAWFDGVNFTDPLRIAPIAGLAGSPRAPYPRSG